MLSALIMLKRLADAVKYALKNPGFRVILGAGIFLVIVGTLTYSLSQDWSVWDAFYFAICTLTTSSIADPSLTLTGEPIKLFTAFYILTGIGILVEIVRQIGAGFIRMRAEESKAKVVRKKR